MPLVLACAPGLASADELSSPRVKDAPEPAWPAARVDRSEAIVPLLVTVKADGTVGKVEAQASGDPELESAAIQAALRWTFEPATRGGRPIAAKIKVAVRFVGEEPRALSAPLATNVPAGVYVGPPRKNASTNAPISEPKKPALPATSRPDERGEPRGEVVVLGPSRPPPPSAAGDHRVRVGQLVDVPRRSAEQLLTLAPGFLLQNHGGEGHPSAIFLRGFSAAEGQDLEMSVGGVPLNEPSNAHGHGYADTHFVIPELVEELRVVEGPFDPRQGDFAVAGSVEYTLGAGRGIVAQAGLGSFGAKRLLLLWGPGGAPRGTFVGFSVTDSDGFGRNRASTAARAMAQYEHRLGAGRRLVALVSAYTTRFDGAGVVRQDDFEARSLDCPKDHDSQFFCTYDPNQGGATARLDASLRFEHKGPREEHTHQVFATIRKTRLRENFTGFVTDVRPSGEPQRGDGVEQMYDTTTFGARGSFTRTVDVWGHRQSLELGYFARHDRGDTLQRRLRRVGGVPYRVDFESGIAITNIAGYAAGKLRPASWLTLRGGIRLDTFGFAVEDRNKPEKDRSGPREPSDTIEAFGLTLGPRASVEINLAQGLAWMTSYGAGSRSSDAQALSDGESAPFARVDAFETGVVFERSEGRTLDVSARALAYFTRVDRDLVFDAARGRNVLVGTSNRFGASISGRLTSRAGIDTQGSLTYAEAYLPEAGAPWYALTSGKRLPYIPRWVARLDTSLRKDLRISGVRLRATGALGTTYVAPRPLPLEQFGHEIFTVDVAARLRYRFVEVGIEATNVLDRRNRAAEFNYASNFSLPDAPASRLAHPHFAAASPRQILGTIRFHLEAAKGEEEAGR
ncbi:TonB-dependent receptor domain-containing protein [Polyangium fumosum]|uniref:TonB-dependent receptor domain-containing protein n=1 Tax=Polyangium fumosum TaxID=889272 RepID=UPI001E4C8581|nr:TonB-dependent receptor [Polyangium fumosum]